MSLTEPSPASSTCSESAACSPKAGPLIVLPAAARSRAFSSLRCPSPPIVLLELCEFPIGSIVHALDPVVVSGVTCTFSSSQALCCVSAPLSFAHR